VSTRLDVGALVLALGIAFAGALAPIVLSSLPSSRSWTAGPLVIAQIAISVILLAGAGLTLRSLYRLQSVRTGFVAGPGVLTMHLDLDWHRYRSSSRIRDFQENLLARIEAIPGVSSAALGSSVPLSGRSAPDPGPVFDDRGERVLLDGLAVSPDYFRAIGAPVLEGRPFSRTDGPHSDPVAIVNQKARAILDGDWIRWEGRRYAIVGVVGDVRHYGLEQEAEPSLYVPLAQLPLRVTDLVVTIEGDTASLSEAVEKAVHEIDPDQAVAFVSTLEDSRRESMTAPALLAALLSAFAALALAITAAGLGGALALAVERRARELGIRQALGAAPADVFQLVYGQGVRLLLAGMGLGLPAALLLSGALSAQLFEIEPRDPWTFAGVILLLASVATTASLVPARRALARNPLAALRLEGG
jgi:predicted permease